MQSGRAALLISLVAMLFLAASVASASPAAIDSLTAAYDRDGRLATANELLRVLHADEGIIDEPLSTFVQRLRMRRARYFLDKHPELNVNDVAALCGYSDTPNFTRAFKKAFGITPTDYSRR
ncbi:MAG: helix-turn-helix transcriptional regulator [Muribaculaceae bacterium]|nr:helix-turn-helix transcriptional regulator [Muribaculaceae bacterium]